MVSGLSQAWINLEFDLYIDCVNRRFIKTGAIIILGGAGQKKWNNNKLVKAHDLCNIA